MDDLYYRPSGQAPMAGIAIGVLCGGLAGAVLAFVYSYAILYIPIVGYVTFILSLGFGGLTGFATGLALRHGKVRSTWAAWATGGLVAAITFYCSWVVWIYALFHRADVQVPLGQIFMHPSSLWTLIVEVNKVGAWTIKGSTPTGAILWIFWGSEALLILVPAVVCAALPIRDPFCEACERWCDERKAVRKSGQAAKEDLVTRIEAKDWVWVGTLGPGEAALHLSYDLHVCPSCEEMHTLTVHDVRTVQEEGKAVNKSEAVVQHLLLTRHDAAALCAAPPAPTKP